MQQVKFFDPLQSSKYPTAAQHNSTANVAGAACYITKESCCRSKKLDAITINPSLQQKGRTTAQPSLLGAAVFPVASNEWPLLTDVAASAVNCNVLQFLNMMCSGSVCNALQHW